MTSHALLFTLAAIGISETTYLINKRHLGERPICPLNKSSCHKVLESQYNKTLWIHNDVLGLIFYITVSIFTSLIVIGIQPVNLLDIIVKLLIYTGALMSAYFTFLQWRVIKSWCTWCLMSALTVFLMAVIVLTSSLI